MKKHTELQIVARSNSGVKHVEQSSDIKSARLIAKRLRTPFNHMVSIEESLLDEPVTRLERWERARAKGGNRWRKVDPFDVEILGEIRNYRES